MPWSEDQRTRNWWPEVVRLKGVGRSPLRVARVGLLAVGPERLERGHMRFRTHQLQIHFFGLKSFKWLISQWCCWCGFSVTIKNLQHIKLPLRVEAFKGNGDIVALLHGNAPGAHLQVRVALRPTGAQDDTRWVIAHLVRGALHCGQTARRDYVKACESIALAELTSKPWLAARRCSDTRAPWQTGGGESICRRSPRRHVRISLPTRENPGWHLYLMMSPGDTKTRWQRWNSTYKSGFSHRFLIKVVEGNKPCTAGLSQDTHIYNRSKAPITLVNTYWDCGWNHREACWTVVESISTAGSNWETVLDFRFESEMFPPPHSPISSSPSSISMSALGTSGGGWQTLNW